MKTYSDNINLLLKKISDFCAYRERCTSEVIEKLRSLGCNTNDCENILQELYAQKFVDDKRFAELFAGSKFRINKWGKIKIAAALKQKQIKREYINAAIDSLINDEYAKTLTTIIEKKVKELKIKEFNDNEIIKLQNYASQKGYETELIIKNISNFKQK